MGGTCVIRGCIPKKLLVYASQFSENFMDARRLWLDLRRRQLRLAHPDRQQGQGNRPAGRALHHECESRRRHHLLTTAPCSRTRTRCCCVNSGKTRHGGQNPDRHRQPARPARWAPTHVIPGGELCITSDEAFHLKELPQRILIAGGGYIALEFAHIFHGLGSHVSLVYRGDKPLRGFDDDMRDALCDSMQAARAGGAAGLRIHQGRKARRLPACRNQQGRA